MTYEQKKFDPEEVQKINLCVDLLSESFEWEATPDGAEYWTSIKEKLESMARYGTNDGKPWIEPEPEKKWRVPTDEDARQRPVCRVRDGKACGWAHGVLIGVGDTSNTYPFAAMFDSGHIEMYSYCEIEDTQPEPATEPETKPIFKVGDKVRIKIGENNGVLGTIAAIHDNGDGDTVTVTFVDIRNQAKYGIYRTANLEHAK